MGFLTQEYKEDWKLGSKLIFRFLFTYFVLYFILSWGGAMFETPIRWVGQAIFKIQYSYDVKGFGSGDNTFSYLSLFVNSISAVFITIVWSLTDTKRKSYNTLLYWLIVLLRVVLIFFMLAYGVAKIFTLQFPAASLTRLLDPLGDFSPMGLAWTYMGYSKSFSIFTGALEVIGALLLIPKRTQTIGSCLIIGVMTQVVAMNFCFDIPVKLFSVHLLFMALIIFLTDHRFITVFFRNKAVSRYHFYNPIQSPTSRRVIFFIKSIGLLLVIGSVSYNFYSTSKQYGIDQEKPLLYGIWETSSFIRNGTPLPPLVTNNFRWRYLIIESEGHATVKTMDDKKHHFKFIPDSTSQRLKIYKKGHQLKDFNFSYTKDSESLELNGIIQQDTLNIKFTRKDHTGFNLNSRGFHWINERPFNR